MSNQQCPACPHGKGFNYPTCWPKVRLYNLVSVHEKTGRKTQLNSAPLTHPEACAMKGKFSMSKHRRIQLEEVTQ